MVNRQPFLISRSSKQATSATRSLNLTMLGRVRATSEATSPPLEPEIKADVRAGEPSLVYFHRYHIESGT